jgi:hypothetical protein
MMKKLSKIAVLFTCVLFFGNAVLAKASLTNTLNGKNRFSFIENKGQVTDQYQQPRADVKFSATDGVLSYFLKSDGISYQQSRVDRWENDSIPGLGKNYKHAAQTTFYRIDVEWEGANSLTEIKAENPLSGHSNFYTPGSPLGITEVKSFEGVLYKNLYTGIDLHVYSNKGIFKYDFLVAAHADYSQIQLKFRGAENMHINSKGDLILETPLGKIIEEAPVVSQNGKVLKSKWELNNNTLRFQIEGVNPNFPFVIDPGVRQWGTYYGGTGGDSGLNSAIDANGNVYMAGTTSSNNGTSIATVGSHQSVYGGGQDNAYLAKFNSAGVRQWSTYYGGPVREFGLNCALDNSGNVFVVGHSLSSTLNIVATPGSHQPVFGGIWDAYLVKFNSNGVRQWGTYYGGPGLEHGNGVACDAAGNIYITGKTDALTSTAIATPGSHQSTFGGVEDAFLAKFNTNGVRQWATYYGGTGTDVGRGVTVDATGNVYLTGWTDNSVANVIATPGAHQNSFGGGSFDAFVVKFNSNGVRQWGTQYGGNGTDMAYDCDIDIFGNVYMAGKTSSSFSIATPGSHQASFGGGPQDAFLVSFNSNGTRNWGTYYGGNGDDESWGCAIHKSGHVYITGLTSSNTGTVMATPGSHQPIYGGGSFDAFIAQFDTAGVRTWGSYYGETGGDVGYGCTTDNAYHVYFVGSTDTNSGISIASPGSHQQNFAGGFGDGFLVKFYDCPAPLAPASNTSSTNLTYCSPGATTLSAISSNSVVWYASPTSTTPIGTSSVYVTPVLQSGVFTYYAEAVSCTVSLIRTPISVTVNPTPTLNISANPTLVCAGKSSTLSVTGANTYTWSNSANSTSLVETPASTSIYTVTGTSSLGCVGSNTFELSVYPLDPVSLVPSTYTSCLTIFGGGPITLTGTPSGGTYSGSNVTGNTLNPTALGVFTPVYSYTNSVNGCVSVATTAIQVFSCLSIDEHVLQGVAVYPNPFENNLYINVPENKIITLRLTDISGRILVEEIFQSGTHGLSTGNLSSGTYFVELSNPDGFIRPFKILKY